VPLLPIASDSFDPDDDAPAAEQVGEEEEERPDPWVLLSPPRGPSSGNQDILVKGYGPCTSARRTAEDHPAVRRHQEPRFCARGEAAPWEPEDGQGVETSEVPTQMRKGGVFNSPPQEADASSLKPKVDLSDKFNSRLPMT
jgi:hypothetical protein